VRCGKPAAVDYSARPPAASRISGESPKFHQVSLQTAYALSKRTDVYLQGEYQHVSDGDNVPGLGATITGVGVSSTENQVSATIGLRHRF